MNILSSPQQNDSEENILTKTVEQTQAELDLSEARKERLDIDVKIRMAENNKDDKNIIESLYKKLDEITEKIKSLHSGIQNTKESTNVSRTATEEDPFANEQNVVNIQARIDRSKKVNEN